MEYFKMIEKFRNDIDFDFIICINNETMKKSFHILSNLYCDPSMIKNEMMSTGSYNQKQYRKRISEIKNILGGKLVLHHTNNDAYHTRLVYKLI